MFLSVALRKLFLKMRPQLRFGKERKELGAFRIFFFFFDFYLVGYFDSFSGCSNKQVCHKGEGIEALSSSSLQEKRWKR